MTALSLETNWKFNYEKCRRAKRGRVKEMALTGESPDTRRESQSLRPPFFPKLWLAGHDNGRVLLIRGGFRLGSIWSKRGLSA